MFVANSARSFIAKYVIHKCDLVFSTNPEETSQRILDDKNLAFISEKLVSKLSHESPTSIAVIETMRILLFENSTTGQKLLQENRMLTECLHLMKVGDDTVCRKLVDVICEMAKNTRSKSCLVHNNNDDGNCDDNGYKDTMQCKQQSL